MQQQQNLGLLLRKRERTNATWRQKRANWKSGKGNSWVTEEEDRHRQPPDQQPRDCCEQPLTSCPACAPRRKRAKEKQLKCGEIKIWTFSKQNRHCLRWLWTQTCACLSWGDGKSDSRGWGWLGYARVLLCLFDNYPIDRSTQFWSFKIRRTTFLNYSKLADILILKLWNSEVAGRVPQKRVLSLRNERESCFRRWCGPILNMHTRGRGETFRPLSGHELAKRGVMAGVQVHESNGKNNIDT